MIYNILVLILTSFWTVPSNSHTPIHSIKGKKTGFVELSSCEKSPICNSNIAFWWPQGRYKARSVEIILCLVANKTTREMCLRPPEKLEIQIFARPQEKESIGRKLIQPFMQCNATSKKETCFGWCVWFHDLPDWKILFVHD